MLVVDCTYIHIYIYMYIVQCKETRKEMIINPFSVYDQKRRVQKNNRNCAATNVKQLDGGGEKKKGEKNKHKVSTSVPGRSVCVWGWRLGVLCRLGFCAACARNAARNYFIKTHSQSCVARARAYNWKTWRCASRRRRSSNTNVVTYTNTHTHKERAAAVAAGNVSGADGGANHVEGYYSIHIFTQKPRPVHCVCTLCAPHMSVGHWLDACHCNAAYTIEH